MITIYTIDEFRCWKVENLDNERSDENKIEKGGGLMVLLLLLVIVSPGLCCIDK